MSSSDQKASVLKNVIEMSGEFSDDAARISGWLHHYVCPGCSSQLRFDRNIRQYQEDRFVCPVCGRTVSGNIYREAWVYQYRQWFAEHLIEAAYCRENEEAIRYLIRYVDFYADHYAQMPEHGTKAGKGRIMAQSLDEAVFGIHVLRAVFYCMDRIPEEKLRKWADMLFLPMAEFLFPQGARIHNISVWLWSYIGMAGLVFGKQDLLNQAVNGPFGLLRQLSEGLTGDMLWREGSLHYHYYALEALTYYCEIAAFKSPGGPLPLLMREMYKAPARLSFDGYRLPSLNDGWYPITIASYAPQILRAACLTGDDEIGKQAERILADCPEAASDSGVMILKDNMPLKRHFLDDHAGMIHAPFGVLLKSGSLVPVHEHKDGLSILIGGVSEDLGTPGYGSPIIKSWYRNSISHNTVSIDGTQNWSGKKNGIRSVPGGLSARVIGGAGDDLVNAERRVTGSGNRVLDHTAVETKKTHVFDWTLHVDGTLRSPEETVPADALYPEFEDTRKLKCNGSVRLEFLLTDGSPFTVSFDCPPDMEVYTASTPGNPASRKRCTLLLRVRGSRARFSAAYEKGAPPEKEKAPESRNKEKKNKWPGKIKRHFPYALLLFASILVLALKANYYVDEMYTYAQANQYGTKVFTIEDGVVYTPAEAPFLQLLTVSPQHRFNFSNVWKNTASGVHPPLYHTLVHGICSLFPGSFSRWYAGCINILVVMLNLLFYRKLTSQFIKERWKRALLSTGFALSAGILTTVSFLRMYGMAMLWTTALTWVFAEEAKRGTGSKAFYLKAAVFTVLGALTHYYCIVYAVLISAVYGIYLILTPKKRKQTWKFCAVMAASGILSCAVYPAILGHVFNGSRGKEVMENAVTLADFPERIRTFVNLTDAELFGKAGWLLLIAAVLLMILSIRERVSTDKNGSGTKKERGGIPAICYILLILPTIGYFFVIAKITVTEFLINDYMDELIFIDRYMFPVYANLLLAAGLLLDRTVKKIPVPGAGKMKNILLAAGFMILIAGSWFTSRWPYLYRSSVPMLEEASSYGETDSIVVYKEAWHAEPDYEEIRRYKSVEFCGIGNTKVMDRILEETASSPDKDRIILFAGLDEEQEAACLAGFEAAAGIRAPAQKIGDFGYGSSYLLSRQ